MRGRQVRAGDTAARALRRLDRNGAMGRTRAVSAWQDAAGPQVAAHAMGFAMREGELVVFVDSPIWANELSALSEHYRTAVNERLGQDQVRAMRFAVSKEVGRARAFEANEEAAHGSYAADRVEPVQATEIERLQIEQMASGIKSEQMREAVIKAATADLEWRKGLKARKSAQGPSEGPRGPESSPEH
jgi:hypothetical protein